MGNYQYMGKNALTRAGPRPRNWGPWSPPAYSDSTVARFGIKCMPLHLIGARFYAALAFKNRAPLFAAAEVEDIASTLLNATLLSCSGEVRYVAAKAHHKLMHLARLDAEWFEQRKLGPFLIRTLVSRGARGAAAEEIKGLGFPPAEALYQLEHAFVLGWRLGCDEKHNIGGPRWAAAARLGREYAEGRLRPVEFVDRVLSQYHNGGPMLNKVFDATVTEHWLDCRAVARPEWLRWFLNDQALAKYGLRQEELYLAHNPLAALYADAPGLLDDAQEVGMEREVQRKTSTTPTRVRVGGRLYESSTTPMTPSCELCETIGISWGNCPKCDDEEQHQCSMCKHYSCAESTECSCKDCGCEETSSWSCRECHMWCSATSICLACWHCEDCAGDTSKGCECTVCGCEMEKE